MSRTLSIVFAALLPLLLAVELAYAEDVVRVRILETEGPQAIAVHAPSGDLSIYAGDFGEPISTLGSGKRALISQSSGQLSILVDGVRLFAEELRIRAHPTLSIEIEQGDATGLERVLPGELLISSGSGDALILENVLDVDDYVASVVSHEYGFDDLEGSKAMAVVARTYALKQLLNPSKPLADHVGSQVYGDIRRVSDVARQAAVETSGQVLVHGGDLIEAVYFSSSGGHTADNDAVWNSSPLPYLRGRPDPFDRASPHREWTSSIDRTDLLRELGRNLGFTVNGFIVGDRGPDGRVRTVEMLRTSGPRKEISSNQFRLIIAAAFGATSLRSTNFDARREGDTYVFTGSGFGHGVGLSQYGARYLAEQGFDHREILAYYYGDVRLAEHRDGVPRDGGVRLEADRILAFAEGRSDDQRPPQLANTMETEVDSDASDREERVTPASRPVSSPSRVSPPKPGRRIGW
ncbi:MAG: SpoIID/LytB domain-containing protein [Bacteroidota bacterium]